MVIQGSCHCGSVRFSATSRTPYPYMSCYCSICRKTAGGGGYAVNIMAEADTLQVQGEQNVSVYYARMPDPARLAQTLTSPAGRHFCAGCGSALWIADPRWPEWIYPFASAIDTPLPTPPEHVRMMLRYAASWCEIPVGETEVHFAEFPVESIEEWHRRQRLYRE